MAKTKREPTDVYVCGYPHCEARITLPDRGDMVNGIPHRDKNGLRCRGMLVKYRISAMARRDQMDWLFERERILARYRKEHNIPRHLTAREAREIMERNKG